MKFHKNWLRSSLFSYIIISLAILYCTIFLNPEVNSFAGVLKVFGEITFVIIITMLYSEFLRTPVPPIYKNDLIKSSLVFLAKSFLVFFTAYFVFSLVIFHVLNSSFGDVTNWSSGYFSLVPIVLVLIFRISTCYNYPPKDEKNGKWIVSIGLGSKSEGRYIGLIYDSLIIGFFTVSTYMVLGFKANPEPGVQIFYTLYGSLFAFLLELWVWYGTMNLQKTN